MSDQTIILAILSASVIVFVWNRLPVGIVALGVMISLWATGVVSLDDAFAGFSSPTVILIAALFVVAEGLNAAGITTWAGHLVTRHAEGNRNKLVILVMGTIAILTALITPNGAVAAMYPMVVVLAVRFRIAPSKLLMPSAFAAHAGALLVLTGSPVTLLVSEAADEAGVGHIGYFEVALVGLPLLLGTLLVVLVLGDRILPVRSPMAFSRDLTKLPDQLKGQYLPREDLAWLAVNPDSPVIGRTTNEKWEITVPGVHIIGLKSLRGILGDGEEITEETKIVVRGTPGDIRQFATANQLEMTSSGYEDIGGGLVSRDFGVAEVIVTPRSDYIGDRVFPGMVTDSGELVILGIQRHGIDLGVSEVTLVPGDSLLLQGRWNALDQHTQDPNVVLVDRPDSIRRQAAPLGPKAVPSLLILATMIFLLASGVVPAAMACLFAAIAMVVLKVVTVPQAHASMAWTTLILVGAMIPLSNAITDSGTAETLATGLTNALGGGGPFLVMTGIFIVTAILGQIISNTATALILIPVTVSVALESGYSVMPMLMSLNVAAAAALMTPIATPANLMVMAPAGYRFGDYWKLGLPIMGVYYLVAVALVPLIWPL